MSKLQLIATSAFGIEAITARELKKLGYFEQKVENGKVTFSGDESAICRTNLWMRTADRILLKMGEFKALSFEELFEQTKALPWDEIIPMDAEFPVEGKSIDSKLFSVPDCQAIVKKAVVEKLKQKYKCEWFEENGPRYRIEVALLKDIVTLTIDTSGAGLHKRGYRKLVGGAPLKETLACAMILVSHWKKDRILLDPFCGSGTIPIEAAMIGRNIAPGLGREFDAEKWPLVPQKLWDDARDEAYDMMVEDQELRIHGSDIDEDAMSIARYHAKKAGVEDAIHLQRLPMSDISSRYKYGIIICNPPYGERLGEKEAVENLYREMGTVFKKLDSWSYYVITSNMEFEKLFGKRADKKRKLYNGRLLCNYYQFFGPPPPKQTINIQNTQQ
ncbi:rRNA (guanine-N(2)-)-methyltransferase [Ruminiclostridium papyrosolvens DSM 2782]|uniref:rRNA (Guanine-N(2)-)-methyltransferase n=1 Tax=Ruminiclostridium papyrosolvens DSM 2782 TaxID=588581 RepID=F1TGI9_9FIRM|nr:class I SAM-dependent RNA methyltransferase [Ruminiclostridium papyrosolvens]EGD46554.1 rRNA (guanine-N(2)-)-methyltransferase [Ruminiclostridium papyrosolvens DSM 2782]WES35284.1 class I SAM-dependent RNA methyltransferase [Ruminiclostridium papyrosolvens DSM 2782]